MPSTEFEQASRAVRWHQSGLETILGCARQWALINVVGMTEPVKLQAVVGTAYHAAVEAHERARMAGQAEGLSRGDMLAAGLAALHEAIVGADEDALAACKVEPTKARVKAGLAPVLYGVEALEHQLETCVDSFWHEVDGVSLRGVLMGWTPLAVEVFASAQIVDGARELGGTMDGIYLDETGRVVLVDHKTAGRLGDWKKAGKGVAQATHYGVLAAMADGLAELAPELPTGSYVPDTVFLVAGRLEPARATTARSVVARVSPSEQDLVELGVRVRDAEETLRLGLFPANPAYQWCGMCPFRANCVGGDRSLMGPIGELL